MARGEHLGTGDQQGHEIERRKEERRNRTPGERHDRRYRYRHGHTYARLGGSAHRRPGLRPDGRTRQLISDQPGGNVSGDRRQFRAGPRSERAAHPQVELVLGQLLLHERDLEHFDRLLPVGLRRQQVAAARPSCRQLVSRTSHHWHLPTSAMQASLARLPSGGPLSDPQIRSHPCGHPDPFRSVRDLGRAAPAVRVSPENWKAVRPRGSQRGSQLPRTWPSGSPAADRPFFRPGINRVGADCASVPRCRRSLPLAVGRCCCCHRCCQPQLTLSPRLCCGRPGPGRSHQLAGAVSAPRALPAQCPRTGKGGRGKCLRAASAVCWWP